LRGLAVVRAAGTNASAFHASANQFLVPSHKLCRLGSNGRNRGMRPSSQNRPDPSCEMERSGKLGRYKSSAKDHKMLRFVRWLVALPRQSTRQLIIRGMTILLATVPAASLAATGDATAQALVPANSTAPTDYLIGPGDRLQIYVWQNPDLTVTVPVRQDGKVSTPLVEDMIAAGKTASTLARDIEQVLKEYVRSPKVNVFVLEAVSALSQVKVTGQVKKPEALPFHDGMRVMDAILAAGGLTDFAAGNRAKLVRTENGKQTEIKVRLDKLLEDGDMTQNVQLQPGDVLLIPQSRF
jgi:polysaccharide export outer membrane protein